MTSVPLYKLLHGILRFGYADELSCEICYPEMRSSLFCMVFCILAMSMNLAGRFAISRCVHFCIQWFLTGLELSDLMQNDALRWEFGVYSIWEC